MDHAHTELELTVYKLMQRVSELELKLEKIPQSVFVEETTVVSKSVTADKGGVAIGGDCRGSIITGQ